MPKESLRSLRYGPLVLLTAAACLVGCGKTSSEPTDADIFDAMSKNYEQVASAQAQMLGFRFTNTQMKSAKKVSCKPGPKINIMEPTHQIVKPDTYICDVTVQWSSGNQERQSNLVFYPSDGAWHVTGLNNPALVQQ